jgi:hypothetical protein
MLDIDHGTYPFVTSSNTVAAQAMIGSGLGNGAVGYVLGIAKAYTTRVGDGPFPTELLTRSASCSATRGNEFGTNTGRPPALRLVRRGDGAPGGEAERHRRHRAHQARRAGRAAEIKVCVGYELDGKTIERFPFTMGAQAKLKPVWETFEGWQESTKGARAYAELPATCIKYVRRIEELVELPGGAALDQPAARGHDPDDGSVQGLNVGLGQVGGDDLDDRVAGPFEGQRLVAGLLEGRVGDADSGSNGLFDPNHVLRACTGCHSRPYICETLPIRPNTE